MPQTKKEKSYVFRLTVTLLHLAFWAELGVLTRAFVGKGLDAGCGDSWGPCLEGGTYFKDMVPNILGCFVMGLFAASSTLGLQTEKPLGVLPAHHSWQSNLELQIGIRAGYCGSLTTFASWQLELMMMAINDNLWGNAVVAYIVGLFTSIIAYVVGQHLALYIDRWVLPEKEDVLEEQASYREKQLSFVRGKSARPADYSEEQRELELLEGSIPTNQPMGQAALTQAPSGSGGEAGASLRHRFSARVEVEEGLEGGDGVTDSGKLVAGGAANGTAPEHRPSQLLGPLARLSALDMLPSKRQIATFMGCKTDFTILVGLILLSAWLAVGTVVERDRKWLRQIWLETLLGPLGCSLRWYLSHYNYRLKGNWAWFPTGTYIVNMLGTAIDFGLQCIIQRGSPGYWGTLLIGATQTGFCGSLTTVSTFVTEVVKFLDVFPDSANAYWYIVYSLGGGILLGLGLYGWAVWA